MDNILRTQVFERRRILLGKFDATCIAIAALPSMMQKYNSDISSMALMNALLAESLYLMSVIEELTAYIHAFEPDKLPETGEQV
jgi:hypothetical protein